MRLIRLMLVAFVLGAPSAALSQEWMDFMSTEDRFSITFPASPSCRTSSGRRSTAPCFLAASIPSRREWAPTR